MVESPFIVAKLSCQNDFIRVLLTRTEWRNKEVNYWRISHSTPHFAKERTSSSHNTAATQHVRRFEWQAGNTYRWICHRNYNKIFIIFSIMFNYIFVAVPFILSRPLVLVRLLIHPGTEFKCVHNTKRQSELHSNLFSFKAIAHYCWIF